jgi:hypothetical protein
MGRTAGDPAGDRRETPVAQDASWIIQAGAGLT